MTCRADTPQVGCEWRTLSALRGTASKHQAIDHSIIDEGHWFPCDTFAVKWCAGLQRMMGIVMNSYVLAKQFFADTLV